MPVLDPNAPPAIEIGDPVPRWTLELTNGATLKSTLIDGTLAIVAFLPSTNPLMSVMLARQLDVPAPRRLEAIDGTIVYVVLGDSTLLGEVRRAVGDDALVCHDIDGAVATKAFGLTAAAGANPNRAPLRVVDRNVRLAGVSSDGAVEGEVARIVETCARLAGAASERWGDECSSAGALRPARPLARALQIAHCALRGPPDPAFESGVPNGGRQRHFSRSIPT